MRNILVKRYYLAWILNNSIVDLLSESAIFLHTLLLVDKKSAEKIILEMIKNSALVVNYMEKTNEFYKDEFLAMGVECDNYDLGYIKKVFGKSWYQ